MSILKPVGAGAAISLFVSYVFYDQEGLPWDLLSISDFEVLGYRLHWSWPVFAVATIATLVLRKALEA